MAMGKIQQDSVAVPKPMGLRVYCIILAIAAIAFYANTLVNDYAFDDRMMILENSIVKKGASAIPELFTTTHLQGFLPLPNDKYRPMSLVMFAVEYGVFGQSPFIGHLVNVLLFAACTVLLFVFLRRLFGESRMGVAFVAALLFAAHPIHTEVVANIKGRDELLSYFFGVLALLSFIKYARNGGAMRLAGGMLLYLLALMSKENVITFLVIVPVIFFFYVNDSKRRSIHIVAGTVFSALVFVGIAYAVIKANGTGLPHEASDFTLNALIAAPDGATRYATAFLALGIYLKLLFVPYPLLCNYSYNAIPFVGFGNVWVLLTVVAYLGLACVAVYRLLRKKKDELAFGILFYMVVMAMFSNLFAMLGSQVAERFLFLPSMGFCLVAALGIEWLVSRKEGNFDVVGNKRALLLLVPLVLVFGGMTIARNADWKDNATLFGKDVEKSPEDCRLNFFMAGVVAPPAGSKDVQAYAAQIDYLRRALAIYPDFIQAHTSLAGVYEATGAYDSAYLHAIAAIRNRPDNSIATYTAGKVLYAMKRYDEAARWLTETVRLAPKHKEAVLNLAGCYADARVYDSAIVYYRRALMLNNSIVMAKRGIAIAFLQTGKYDSALYHMSAVVAIEGNVDDMNNLGAIYVSAKRYNEAIGIFKRIIAANATYSAAYENLAIAYEQMGIRDSAAIYRGMNK